MTPNPAPSEDVGRRWDRRLAIAGVALAVAAAVTQWSLALAFDLSRLEGVPASLAGLVLAVVGGLVLVRGHARRYGVLVLAFGVVATTYGLADAWVDLAWVARPDVDWPLATAAAWYQDTWLVLFMFMLLLVPGLFPDGRPASPAWGRALRITTGVWLVLIAAFMTANRPLAGFFEGRVDLVAPLNPVGLWPALPIDAGLAFGGPWVAVSLVSVIVGIGSLVTRWRVSDARTRRQLVVVAAALCVFLVTTALHVLNQFAVEAVGLDLGLEDVLSVAFGATVVLCAVAFGVAVLRHRLFDIDAVVTRTVTYGLLTVAVVGTYVLVVVGVGALVPDASPDGLALVATGLVAVAFDPARRRLQAGVDRTLFGLRGEPYEVLARLGGVMAEVGAADESLRALVDTVATSLKLPWVAIDLHQGDGEVARAEHGTRPPGARGLVALPVVHQDVEVGQLRAAPRSAGEPLGPADRRLLADIARQAGAVAATARLTLDLQRSRERLVVAREEERRRVRRDLHDGLGPALRAQGRALAAAVRQIDTDPDRARALLLAQKRETQRLVAEVRRIVQQLDTPPTQQPGAVSRAAIAPGAGSSSRAAHVLADAAPGHALGHLPGQPAEAAHG